MTRAGDRKLPLRNRVKVQLTDEQLRILASKAKTSGTSIAAYARSALLSSISDAAPLAEPKRGERSAPLRNRLRVQYSDQQLEALKAKAASVAMTVTAYCRWAVLSSMGLRSDQKPTSPRTVREQQKIAELSLLGYRLGKLGSNVNQLARQANTGMVPLSRAEVQYMLNQHQVVMSELQAGMERLLK